MLALMLDPRFKGLKYIIDKVEVVKAKEIVQSYDIAILLPFLVKVHKTLNPLGMPTLAHVPKSSSLPF